MPNDQYKDPILRKYADLITSQNKVIKSVFFGDPIRIGASELPAMVIAKIDTRVSNQSNMEDRHDLRISITIVTDVRETVSEDKTMVRGVNALYNLMEGREESNYYLKSDSLLHILRNHVTIDAANNLFTDLDSFTRIDYGMTLGKRGENMWAIEGTLELTATFIQLR